MRDVTNVQPSEPIFSWAQDNPNGAPKVKKRKATGPRIPKPKPAYIYAKLVAATHMPRWQRRAYGIDNDGMSLRKRLPFPGFQPLFWDQD